MMHRTGKLGYYPRMPDWFYDAFGRLNVTYSDCNDTCPVREEIVIDLIDSRSRASINDPDGINCWCDDFKEAILRNKRSQAYRAIQEIILALEMQGD